MIILPHIALDLKGVEYLQPYMERVFGSPDDVNAENQPTAGIKVFTDERGAKQEDHFEDYCSTRDLPVASLWCPNIVCTGMQGLPRRIAQGLFKGSFFHIQGNEARISVVHGTDVAKAAALVAGAQGQYTVTDGTDPLIHDLAEALAYRLGDKRIFTIKPWMAKLWYGAEFFDALTQSHVSPATFNDSFHDFKPAPVVEYLRTHHYGEDSL